MSWVGDGLRADAAPGQLDDSSPTGPTGSRRLAGRAATAGLPFLIGVLIGLVAIGLVDVAQRPPPRILPAPIHDSVLIVPIGDMAVDRLAGLVADYRTEYGLTVTVADPLPLAPAAFDPARGQYIAQGLIESMWAAHPEERASQRVVIGITSADIYIRDVSWKWAFALRQAGRLAVISTARMIPSRAISRDRLMRTMLTREIGFLCYGLPPTDNPRDILYRDILGLDDLRRLNDRL